MTRLLSSGLVFLWAITAQAAWQYDWSARTDQCGKPAGIFTTTPFPIWETNTSYTVTNDESPNGKTFQLGTLHFIDGAAAVNGDGSWASPWNRLTNNMLASAGTPSNTTIIIRGAHDAFDGVYYGPYSSDNLYLKPGIDDTHRFMVVGYGQERPIFDGTLANSNLTAVTMISMHHNITNGFATIQRIEVRNCGHDAVNFEDATHNYVNTIDCLFTNVGMNIATVGNAAIYYSGNGTEGPFGGWITHCTVLHTLQHGFKNGDGASGMTVEWCVAGECGYWPTIAADTGITNWWGQIKQPSVCFDFPNDTGVVGMTNVLRYSIAYEGLAQGIQIRNCSNFQCYANEVYQCPNLTGNATLTNADGISYTPQGQIWIGGLPGSGPTMLDQVYVHNNWIHDNPSTNSETCGIGVALAIGPSRSVWIYNNLLSSNGVSGFRTHGYNETFSNYCLSLLNNTIYQNNNQSAVYVTPNTSSITNLFAGELKLFNNIIVNAGGGTCLTLNSNLLVGTDYDYNLFYYPGGTLGWTPATHDVNAANPLFSSGGYQLQATSPAVNSGTNLSAFFTTDFLGNSRTLPFDMGAYEYIFGGPTTLNVSGSVNVGTLRSAQ